MHEIWIRTLLVLVANLRCFVISKYDPDLARADDPFIPLHCAGRPEIMMRQCCIFPPFFSTFAAKECGAVGFIQSIDKHDVATFVRKAVQSKACDHWRCMLAKYKLIRADGKVDVDSYYEYLQQWVEYNPFFKKVMLSAKITCRQQLEDELLVCEFSDLQICLRKFINLSCPSTQIIKSKDCEEWKVFYDNCRQYYIL